MRLVRGTHELLWQPYTIAIGSMCGGPAKGLSGTLWGKKDGLPQMHAEECEHHSITEPA